jgi:uncharacterized protein (DUF736 family)
MNYEQKNEGCVWKRVSQNGLEYMSGNIVVEGKKYNIAMFINDKKGNDKAPDFRIKFNEDETQPNEQTETKSVW